MADNITVPGTGEVLAYDDVGGIKYERVKPTFGADGTAVDQAIAAAGIPKVGDTDSLGQAQYNFPAGFVRVSDEPRQLFYDPFESLDTTNRWNAATASGGGVAASVTGGVLTLGSGVTASGISHFQSQPSFTPTVPSWLGASFAISLEFPLTTNASRFWGVGSSPGTPTAAIPITDGYGFEVDTAGALNAVVFAAGVRTIIAALTVPADALNHRYIVYYRTDRIFWYVDSLATPVATSNFQGPAIQTLPLKLSAVAHTAAPAASRVISGTGLAVWDTGKNNTQISDGTYPWRKATVNAQGALTTNPLPAATSVLANVASSATSVTIQAANANRLGLTIFNDSTALLYVKFGTTASATSYTVQVAAGGYYEVPLDYTGRVDGIWAAANGFARVTELSA